ncbi:MAG: CPBP family intramembrane metalloprotease [Clostridia bacterium]|jgi:membrane protease YdiL (CAAX protease family)|nr:CPBP family intramembrane metalloprotease [Clostridia bacterium]
MPIIEKNCSTSHCGKIITILHIIIAFAIWIVSQLPAIIIMQIPQQEIAIILNIVVQISLVACLISLYGNKVAHVTMTECRVTKFTWKPIWLACAFTLPFAVTICLMIFIPGKIIIHEYSFSELIGILVNGVVGSCIGAAVTEEIIFRGFAMRVTEKRFGIIVGMIAPSIIFATAHVVMCDNMGIQDFALLLIAGTSAGIMFSMITYHSNSIWPSIIVHGLWNLRSTFIGFGDKPDYNQLLTYVFSSDNSKIMTGGNFGVESSLIAIIFYWIVILLAAYMIKKHH